MLHARSAFDVFTASDAANVARYTAEKDRKYREAVQAAGDAFFAVPFTPSGTPYPAAMALLEKVVHTGDKLPLTVDGMHQGSFTTRLRMSLKHTLTTLYTHARQQLCAQQL